MKVTIQYIKLASHEWGSPFMQQVAETYLRSRSSADGPTICIVDEHAGWSLGWALIDDQMICVTSANDACVFGGKAAQFHEAIKGAEFVYAPTIWREREEATYAHAA